MELGKIVDIYDLSNFQKNSQLVNINIYITNNVFQCNDISIKLNKNDVGDNHGAKYYNLKNILLSYGILKKKEYTFLISEYITVYFRLYTKKNIKIDDCRKFVHDKMLCVNRCLETICITAINNDIYCDSDYIQIQMIKSNTDLDHYFVKGRVYSYIRNDIHIFDSDVSRYTLILELDIHNDNDYHKINELESLSKGKTVIIPAYYLFKKEHSNEEQEGEIEITIIPRGGKDNRYAAYIKNFILPNNIVVPVEKRKNDYIKYYSKIFDISLASKYELISYNDYNKIKEELEKEQIKEITLNFDDFETLFYNYNIMDLCITGYAK